MAPARVPCAGLQICKQSSTKKTVLRRILVSVLRQTWHAENFCWSLSFSSFRSLRRLRFFRRDFFNVFHVRLLLVFHYAIVHSTQSPSLGWFLFYYKTL